MTLSNLLEYPVMKSVKPRALSVLVGRSWSSPNPQNNNNNNITWRPCLDIPRLPEDISDWSRLLRRRQVLDNDQFSWRNRCAKLIVEGITPAVTRIRREMIHVSLTYDLHWREANEYTLERHTFISTYLRQFRYVQIMSSEGRRPAKVKRCAWELVASTWGTWSQIPTTWKHVIWHDEKRAIVLWNSSECNHRLRYSPALCLYKCQYI